MRNSTKYLFIVIFDILLVGCGSNRGSMQCIKSKQIIISDIECDQKTHQLTFAFSSETINFYKSQKLNVIESTNNVVILQAISSDKVFNLFTPEALNSAIVNGKIGDIIHIMCRDEYNQLVYLMPYCLNGKSQLYSNK